MKKTQEAAALGRILYLLEENSVGYLAMQDTEFKTFVRQLYSSVSREVHRLQQT